MNNNKKTGDFGEDIASRYLIKNGYKIITRNYKVGFDEIDIISKAPEGTLVFIEVKTLRTVDGVSPAFMPEDQMTGFKLKKITRACQKFANRNSTLVSDDGGWRVDLIAVILKTEKTGLLRHYKNI